MVSKKWWRSKTVWFGILASIIGGVEAIVRANGGTVSPIVYEIEAIATGILIILFRFITNTPVTR